MKLILSRHGEAETLSKTFKDIDRDLNETGILEITKMAKFILNSGLKPGSIFHSPYNRTTQTAKIYSKYLSNSENIFASKLLLPSSEYSDFLTELKSFKNSDCVLIVGHNPNISFFASSLISEFQLERNFPFLTGTTIALNIPKETFSKGQLIWMISPEFLKEDLTKS